MTHEEMMARGKTAREGAATIEKLDAVLLEGREPWYMFNTYSTEHQINLGTAGQYYVPPCEEGKEWTRSPTVIPGVVADTYPHFTDKEEYRVRAIPGDTVLASALGYGPGQGPDEDLRRFGIFGSHNSSPSKAELVEAKKRLIPYLNRLLQQADRLNASADPQERKSVESEHFARAARHLGVKKPWLMEQQEMTTCPFCAAPIRPNVPKCAGCGEVVDPVAYAALKKQISGAV